MFGQGKNSTEKSEETKLTKKKKGKTKWIIIGIIVVFVLLIAFSGSGTDKTDSSVTTSTTTQQESSENVEIKQDSSDDVSNTETEKADTEFSIADTETTDDKESLKKALEDKENLVWFGDVRNDVTGNWKLSEYASADTLQTFAVEYYNAFFESDDEIHAVINMSTNVTGQISKVMDDTLDVTLYEYVEDEEHDAKELFGGMLLKEYWVTISTGEVEEIQ